MTNLFQQIIATLINTALACVISVRRCLSFAPSAANRLIPACNSKIRFSWKPRFLFRCNHSLVEVLAGTLVKTLVEKQERLIGSVKPTVSLLNRRQHLGFAVLPVVGRDFLTRKVLRCTGFLELLNRHFLLNCILVRIATAFSILK